MKNVNTYIYGEHLQCICANNKAVTEIEIKLPRQKLNPTVERGRG